jgi:hypothetical protein
MTGRVLHEPLYVIASEATQSRGYKQQPDYFVASAPRNDRASHRRPGPQRHPRDLAQLLAADAAGGLHRHALHDR